MIQASCNCGCGNPATLKSGWIRGHWNRGKHRTTEQKKRYSDAKIGNTWNMGKTKADDPRIARHAEKVSEWLVSAYATGKKVPWNLIERTPEYVTKLKMAKFCRNSLHRCLALSGTTKRGQTFEILGYTPRMLIEHLEKQFVDGMSWENYGRYEGTWTIDHKRPVSEFPLDASPAEVNALDNLQPMWWRDNIVKGPNGFCRRSS